MEETGRELSPGTVLAGRYEILERLGTGSFGSVYRARDRDLKTDYALKFLKHWDSENPSEALERFKREALLSQRVSHEACCRIYDFLEIGGRFILKMEFVDGWTLAQVLARLNPMPLPLALSLAAQASVAVATLHRQDVIHRDIKASNLMVNRRGQIKVMDLGCSRAPEMSSLTMAGTLLGTPSYMAPELILHQEAFPQTDVYALGALAYYLLSGRLPFAATDLVRLFMMQVQSDPVSLRQLRPELSIQVDELVLRCLNKDYNKRPKNAVALEEAWREVLSIRPEPELIREILNRHSVVLNSDDPWLTASDQDLTQEEPQTPPIEEQTRSERVILPVPALQPTMLAQLDPGAAKPEPVAVPSESVLARPIPVAVTTQSSSGFVMDPEESVPLSPAEASSVRLAWFLVGVLAVLGILVVLYFSR